jgi:hypothetical protein
VFEYDAHGRQAVIGHDLKVGCGKCFASTIVSWRRMYSDNALEAFRDTGDPEIMAVAIATEMQQVAARADTANRAAQQREAEWRRAAESANERFRAIQFKRARRAKKKRRNRR